MARPASNVKLILLCVFAASMVAALVWVVSVWARGGSMHAPEHPWTAERQTETIARGDRIGVALMLWHESHGSFPESLNDLVPVFLDEVPHPVAGVTRWYYERTPRGFRLTFGTHTLGGGGVNSLYPVSVLSIDIPLGRPAEPVSPTWHHDS